MFVPDILHEFELGVWKAIFSHLMRILYASRDNCITVLNWRYVCYKIYMSVSIYGIDIDMFRHSDGEQFANFIEMHLP